MLKNVEKLLQRMCVNIETIRAVGLGSNQRGLTHSRKERFPKVVAR